LQTIIGSEIADSAPQSALVEFGVLETAPVVFGGSVPPRPLGELRNLRCSYITIAQNLIRR
jgi:hypothetical protein